MTFLPMMRVAAQLRRIAKALEHANYIAEEELRLDHPESPLSFRKKRAKLLKIDTPSIKEWNEQWQQRQQNEQTQPD